MTKAPAVPLAALLIALFVPACGTYVYFVASDGGWISQGFFIGTKVFNWVFPLVFIRRVGLAGLGRTVPEGGPYPTLGRSVVEGLVFGLVISALALGLMVTPLGEIIRAGARNVSEKLQNLGVELTVPSYVLFAAYLSFVNAAMEEYYWRWFIYGNLRKRMKKWIANVVVAVGFVLHHLIVTLQFFRWEMAIFLCACIGIGSILWGWLYDRQGSVVGAYVCHILIDIAIMLIGYQIVFG